MDFIYDQKQTKRLQEKLKQIDRFQPKWRVVNDMSQSHKIQSFQSKQLRPKKFQHKITSQDTKFKTLQVNDDVFRKSHQTLLLKQSFNKRLGLQSQQSTKSQILLQQQNNKFMLQQSAIQNANEQQRLSKCLIQKDYKDCNYLFANNFYCNKTKKFQDIKKVLPDLNLQYQNYKSQLNFNQMQQQGLKKKQNQMQISQIKLLDKNNC